MGPSSIGKSECALDLIVRGHKFVADDIVQIEKDPDGTLIARPLKPETFLLNIRGVGIVDVKKIYGTSSVSHQMPVDLLIELVEHDNPNAFDLVGDTDQQTTLLGVSVKKSILPARTRGLLVHIVELLSKQRQVLTPVNH